MIFGRLPTRLTTTDSLTAAQGELMQARAELGKIAKAVAESRAMLSEVESINMHLRDENERLRLKYSALKAKFQEFRAVNAQHLSKVASRSRN